MVICPAGVCVCPTHSPGSLPVCRFFPLLGKQKPGHPECCVLLNVFALLSVKNASPKTIAMVMDIAESLLTTEDFVTMDTENEAEKEVELCVNDCVVPDLGGATDITAGGGGVEFLIGLKGP